MSSAEEKVYYYELALEAIANMDLSKGDPMQIAALCVAIAKVAIEHGTKAEANRE